MKYRFDMTESGVGLGWCVKSPPIEKLHISHGSDTCLFIFAFLHPDSSLLRRIHTLIFAFLHEDFARLWCYKSFAVLKVKLVHYTIGLGDRCIFKMMTMTLVGKIMRMTITMIKMEQRFSR